MTRWTEDDVQRVLQRQKPVDPITPTNKYRNVKISMDGYTFDSKREAQHYQELKLREKAGEITELRLQVPFNLLAPTAGDDVVVAQYVADFTYRENGALRVIDVKGVKTAVYRLKKKWLELQEGIAILEV